MVSEFERELEKKFGINPTPQWKKDLERQELDYLIRGANALSRASGGSSESSRAYASKESARRFYEWAMQQEENSYKRR